jgi:short-subunit dehydrogenase
MSQQIWQHGFYEPLHMEHYQQRASITGVCPWWVVTEFHAAQLNKDGVPLGTARGQDYYSSKTMIAECCAEFTLHTIYKRRRDALLSPSPVLIWLKVLAPNFLGWLAVELFLKPFIHRTRATQTKMVH